MIPLNMTHESFKTIERLDQLIRIKATGSPDFLANRLGISRRSLTNYLSFMKENGAPIKFCFYRQSYYYDEDGFFKISFCFKKKENKQQEIVKI